jgi:cation diffusion facilitator CzcD-associated flavoprotein CzcO
VLVIGAGKSALDCACLAGEVSDSCTLIFRKPYWMLPRYYGRTRVDKLVYSRWMEKMSYPPYHQSSAPEKLLRGICAPLVSLFRWRQRQFTVRATRMPRFMVPDMPIHASIFHLGIGSDIYRHIRSGQVQARRGEIDRFTGGHGVRLDNGESIEADVVICATGWRRNLDFLDGPLQDTLFGNGQLRLYRHILPPTEPRLGFVGYASSTNSPLTSEIAAHWLSQHFLGKLQLPDTGTMERSIDKVLKWTARNFPQQREGHFIGGYVAHYTDWLLRDMGLRRRRRTSLASEHLHPFRATRVRGLEQERRRVPVSVGSRGNTA